jgi:hypothetical protein
MAPQHASGGVRGFLCQAPAPVLGGARPHHSPDAPRRTAGGTRRRPPPESDILGEANHAPQTALVWKRAANGPSDSVARSVSSANSGRSASANRVSFPPKCSVRCRIAAKGSVDRAEHRGRIVGVHEGE